MKNVKKYLLLFFAATIIVSCGDEDLEPVLSLDKDLATGIQSAGDLASVLNSAYDRMTVSGSTISARKSAMTRPLTSQKAPGITSSAFT